MDIWENHKKRIFYTFFALIVTAIALFFSLRETGCKQIVGTVLSVVGSMASIYGIIEAILKIRSVAEEQKSIKLAVETKIETLDKQSIGMTLSQHVEMCNHVIMMLQKDNAEASVIYLNALRDFFMELEAIPVLALKGDAEIRRKQNMLKSDLSKLRSVRTMSDLDMETKNKMINNLSNLQEYLCRFSKQLKYEGHEKQSIQ